MASNSISNVPLPSLAKDLGKKKRANKLAKLKQCKLDVRREQWLSQVKKKGCKDDSSRRSESPPSSMQIANEGKKSLDCCKTRSRGEEKEGLSICNTDLESLMNTPIRSSLDNNDLREGLSVCNSGTISAITSEEEEDGCLDDWEAVADALNADDLQHSPIINSPAQSEASSGLAEHEQCNKDRLDLPKAESQETATPSRMNRQAWMPDDTYRPQSLPSLSKQESISINSDWHCGHRAIPWAWQHIMSQPSSCPICYEDLDVTDSRFLPCSCGFRLCLFCHKRILESDGRCPGCRKQYDLMHRNIGFNGGTPAFRVVHS